MFEDCLAAKKILDTGYTCVLCYKGMILTSKDSGVLPLIQFLDSKFDFTTFSICDKVIGKSAAVLIIKLGIKNVFTYVLTKDAKELFDKHEITYRYNELVDKLNANPSIYNQLDELIEIITDIDDAVNMIYEEIKK